MKEDCLQSIKMPALPANLYPRPRVYGDENKKTAGKVAINAMRDFFYDNRDNLRPNQLPRALQGNFNSK